MKHLITLLALFSFVISSCAAAPENYTDLEERTMDMGDTDLVFIQVDYGEVEILQTDDPHISIQGQVLYPEELEYKTDSVEGQILIKALSHRGSSSKDPLRLIVRLPKQVHVKVETQDANIIGQGVQGDLEVDSVSGDITLNEMNGRMTLHSNRGNIKVQESSGIISIVGNYGALTTQDVHGETAMSTIMGNIMFSGSIADRDIVRLEADHGTVSVNLSADSALTLQAHSTSGDVTCMLPGLTSTTRTCDGKLQAGGGSLTIRTVSGAVTLQQLP